MSNTNTNSNTNKDNNKDDNKDIKKDPKMELTEDDKEYKKNIDDMVLALFDKDITLIKNAYELIKKEITQATSSMTSIPLPLKFFRLHYQELKEAYNSTTIQPEIKTIYAKLLSVLTLVTTTTTDTALAYILENKFTDFEEWGLEYIRTLSGEICTEYINRLDSENDNTIDDLKALILIVVPYLMKNNNQNEAIDLLIEIDLIEDIKNYTNETNYKKICLYLLAISNYSADSEDQAKVLHFVYEIYTKYNQTVNALRVAIKLNEKNYIKSTFVSCSNKSVQLQMAYILSKQKVIIDDIEDEKLKNIINNLNLSDTFSKLTRQLELDEPKCPEDYFKSHLEDKKSDLKIESYKSNLSSSIANGFINACHKKENLIGKKDSDWLSKNKEEGTLCALASLGLVNMWDIDCGPNEIEKYMDENELDPFKRGGYNLGLGILSSGVVDENNTAFALLSEQLVDKNLIVKISSIFGLGLAYANTQNEDLNQPLTDVLEDFSFGYEISAFTSLALGLIFQGSCNEDVIGNLISILIARVEDGKNNLIKNKFNVLYILGMGLVLFGSQKESDLMIEATQLELFPEDLRLYIKTLLTACAYAGSGNVIKIQEMQHLVAKKTEDIDPKIKSIAVIGMSLIALGEETGMEMIPRALNRFLQYGDNSVKRAVPLASGLLNISHPKVAQVDSLLKFAYDQNKEIAMNSIFSLGLMSAGTNNSRIATQLRTLAGFYAEDANVLSIVRMAQGLLHISKGANTLNPLSSNNFLLNKTGLAGIMISMFAFTEVEELICDKYQYLIYSLCLAMQPRMLMTINENEESKPIKFMVGQSVDTVGAQGNPRTIAGFQIHTTPLLINKGERCEFDNDEYLADTDILEGVVIVRENPIENRLINKK